MLQYISFFIEPEWSIVLNNNNSYLLYVICMSKQHQFVFVFFIKNEYLTTMYI